MPVFTTFSIYHILCILQFGTQTAKTDSFSLSVSEPKWSVSCRGQGCPREVWGQWTHVRDQDPRFKGLGRWDCLH